MHVCPRPAGEHLWRLLPSLNPDPHDRALAWDTWLSGGGADPVLKFIRWSNGTATEDDEILQDAIITAYEKVELGEYELRDVPFTAFVKKIAWYKIMEAARRHARHVPLDDAVDVPDDDHVATERVEFWREHEALQGALKDLPPRRSRVLLLYEDGFTTSEIARQLSIREDLVRKEKSLGLRQLRDSIAPAVGS